LKNLKRNKMEKEIFRNKYIWMFKEHHEINCDCSYCKSWISGQNKMHYGLNIPPAWKAANAWYTIKYGKGKYLRWVNSWIRLFKKK